MIINRFAFYWIAMGVAVALPIAALGGGTVSPARPYSDTRPDALACAPLAWPQTLRQSGPNVAHVLATFCSTGPPRRSSVISGLLLSAVLMSPNSLPLQATVAKISFHHPRPARRTALDASALLCTLTRERSGDLRLAVVQGLAAHAQDSVAFDLLIFALNDSEDAVRILAMQTLTRQIGYGNLAAYLRTYLQRPSATLPESFRREFLSTLQRAEQFHLEVPFRFPMHDLEILMALRRPTSDPRPVAVVLHAVSDDDKNVEELKNLGDSGSLVQDAPSIMSLVPHYHVFYFQIASNEEFAQAILAVHQATGRFIDFFMLDGHIDSANQRAWWGPRESGVTAAQELANQENYLAIYNPYIFKKYPLSDRFAPGAVLVLNGCKTGLGRALGNNFANFFRAQIPQAGAIFSSVEEVDRVHFVFGSQGVIDVDWENSDFIDTKGFSYLPAPSVVHPLELIRDAFSSLQIWSSPRLFETSRRGLVRARARFSGAA